MVLSRETWICLPFAAVSKHRFHADVFIAHFGPAGVTAAKLRELGVIRGKIATIFHGIDISSREVLNHYTLNINNCFAVAT